MSKILGLDYGEKRIGIAISSEDRQYSFPYEKIDNTTKLAVLNWFRNVIQEEEVNLFVIGMPFDQYGKIGDAGKKVEKFGIMLEQELGIKVAYEDERFSSVMASKQIQASGLNSKKSRSIIDQQSAQIILQTYLERHHG